MIMSLFSVRPHQGLRRILIHTWNTTRYSFVYLDDSKF